MRRRGQNKKKIDSPIAMLLSPFADQIISDENYPELLAFFASNAKEKGFEESLSKLLKRKRVRKFFSAYTSRIEDFFSLSSFQNDISDKRLLLIYKQLLLSNHQEINMFVEFRNKFENLMLTGQYQEAEI